MGRIGTSELLVIFLIALVIFGPKQLPELGKMLGKAIGSVKHYADSNTWAEEAAKEEAMKAQPAAGAQAAAAQPAAGVQAAAAQQVTAGAALAQASAAGTVQEAAAVQTQAAETVQAAQPVNGRAQQG